ncbi:MAG TPA: NTP pyrophosphohydrolase [Pseudonocardiaceae bacterium]|jgi:hypothetical protein|nr:NTP pyrophosphohydrolase [Pseudonocardiaceae bacterium]
MSHGALVVIDAANVVGSVPDGWWRDRAGATAALRDRLDPVVLHRLVGGANPPELVLVVEGRARGVTSTDRVRVVAASGSGDDTVVALVAAEDAGRDRVVVTADRELIRRVQAVGARVLGPRSVRNNQQLPDHNVNHP